MENENNKSLLERKNKQMTLVQKKVNVQCDRMKETIPIEANKGITTHTQKPIYPKKIKVLIFSDF